MSNQTKKALFTAVFTIFCSFSPFALAQQDNAAQSGKTKDSVVSASNPKNEAEKTLMKLSQDGFSAMRSVRAARIALFNGKTESVSELMNAAKVSLEAAEKEAPSFAVKVNETVNGKNVENETETAKVDLIPIDATLAVADDYVPTNEKKLHIAKANEHFKKGEHKEAMNELRLAEVDLNYTRTLMPIKATIKRVDQAIKLLAEHKYYEANLALKAAEDGLTVETVNLAEPVAKHKAPAKPAKK
ncbi:MAG: YfdX family protein [Methylocystis sp.]|uniref:YfdX family protein n=1 Tax=Methylocystis sp. TaxID=1911079 RepID=UPI003D14DDF4